MLLCIDIGNTNTVLATFEGEKLVHSWRIKTDARSTADELALLYRGLLAADNVWGAAAGLWIASGLGRVFFGGKEPAFYWRNGFFWVKLALFGLVFALESMPMATFIRVRSARRRNTALPRFPVDAFRRINSAEIVLVVAIVVVAAFMARGAWLF